jgi:hypothetical protein
VNVLEKYPTRQNPVRVHPFFARGRALPGWSTPAGSPGELAQLGLFHGLRPVAAPGLRSPSSSPGRHPLV